MKVKGFGIILIIEIMASPFVMASAPKLPYTKDQVFNSFPGGKANASTKDNMPEACNAGSSTSWMSFIKQVSPDINHPAGSALFPDDGKLGQLLNTFLTNLNKDDASKAFTVYFTKMHLMILDQLYKYLTKIYAVFNMTHIDTMDEYLTLEAKQALNKKTLIIDHLINIIEAQSNGAIVARFPTLPANLATYCGNVLMKQDYGVDLSVMIDNAETIFIQDPNTQAMINPTLKATKDNYLNLLADYLRLFDQYTKTLNQDDTSQGYVGVSEFVKHAERIVKIMQGAHPKQDKKLKMEDQIKWLRSINKLNPPMFFYNGEAMRGLKLIPSLAKSLPPNVQSVPWPKKIVEAADSGKYYKPKYGPQTTTKIAYYDSPAKKKLFVNIPTMQYTYAQELLPQPAWLNSVDGIMKMTQACLGDFSKLLDPLLVKEIILDPCLRCIIQNASVKAGLVSSAPTTCKECAEFIDMIKQGVQKSLATMGVPQINLPNVPTIDGGIS